MRWYIIHTLFIKEAQRHLANRSGIVLAILLVGAALLLSLFNPDKGGGSTGLVGGVHKCFVDFDFVDDEWLDHLRNHIPDALKGQILFRELPNAQPGTGTIRIRLSPGQPPTITVTVLYPEGQPQAMEPYVQWFWLETRRHYQNALTTLLGTDSKQLPSIPKADDPDWATQATFNHLREIVNSSPNARSKNIALPYIVIKREQLSLTSVLDAKIAISMGLVVFSLFFTCVYLLPAFTCEERERGVLLAQALSPASPLEIVLAKFLFYPLSGMSLASLLVLIYRPAVLQLAFFWLSLFAVALGFLGIGMVVACLAKTQRAASMGALTYALCMAMLLLICQQNNIPILPQLALEYHGPKILHAALQMQVYWFHWMHLLGAMCLAVTWCAAAAILFRRRGWQ